MSNSLIAQRNALKRLSNKDITINYDPDRDSFQCDLKHNIIHTPISPNSLFEANLSRLRFGFDHETAHLLFSDNIDVPNKLFSLTNAIEDGRVNNLFSDRYKGVRENINQYNCRVFKTIENQTDKLSLRKKIQSVFYERISRPDLNHLKLIKKYNLQNKKFSVKQFSQLLDKATYLSSTMDSLELAKEVFEFFDWPYDQSNNGSYSQQKQVKESNNQDQSFDDENEEEVMNDPSEEFDAVNEEIQEELDELINDVKDNGVESGEIYQPYTDSDDILEFDDNEDLYDINIDRYISVLRQKLLRDLIDSKKNIRKHQEKGQLDDEKVTDIILGEPDVFQKDVTEQKIDTAMSVPLDFSGSMGTSKKIDRVREFAYLITKTASLLDLNLSVFGYNSDKNTADDVPENVNRKYPFYIHMIKDFSDRYIDALSNIKSIGVEYCDGYTFIGEALEFSINQLYNRSESRKVILLMSDGQPQQPDDSRPVRTHFRNVSQQLKNSNEFEVIGLDFSNFGVMSEYCDHTIHISSVDNFVNESYDAFSNILRGRY